MKLTLLIFILFSIVRINESVNVCVYYFQENCTVGGLCASIELDKCIEDYDGSSIIKKKEDIVTYYEYDTPNCESDAIELSYQCNTCDMFVGDPIYFDCNEGHIIESFSILRILIIMMLGFAYIII